MGKFEDLTGQKFGRLTVVKQGDTARNGDIRWWCQCDCGNVELVLVRTYHLNSGHTKSCGCLRNEAIKQPGRNKKYNRYDLSGKYGIGWTSKNEEFYFDIEDYDKIKDYCWYINNRQYVCAKVDKKQILLHRVVLQIDNNYEIDHIQGKQSRHDNRKSNLRICTHSENMKNVGLRIDNTSGVTGVHFDKGEQKWIARIVIDGKRIVLGEYNNFENAKRKRLEAEKEYYGEFSYYNSQSYITN